MIARQRKVDVLVGEDQVQSEAEAIRSIGVAEVFPSARRGAGSAPADLSMGLDSPR